MTQASSSIPKVPPIVARALSVLPLAPLSLSLTAYSKRVAAHHPSLFRRLGEHDHARFVLDPTDLPFVIELAPNGGVPKIKVVRGQGAGDARIAGPIAALLGLVHGAFDGDALFFSRDLVIEGDTAAALALRNAVDDAELDLSDEIARLTGPLSKPLKTAFAFLERRTGVSFTRPEEVDAW